MTTPGVPAQQNSCLIVIDDDPNIHRLVTAFVRPLGVEVRCASSGAEGLELMRAAPPDLVILDYDMPGQNGLEVLRSMRSEPQLSTVEVIFATGNVVDTMITECYAAGATDYIRKPLCRAELMARVRSSLERHRLLEELKSAARLDQLTGLPNRALLMDRLNSAIARLQRMPGYHFALLFLDIDRFKIINDSFGHDMGDKVLREAGSRLQARLRPTDSINRDSEGITLSRLGGDEFVVLLDAVRGADAARIIAERVLETLNEPYHLHGHTLHSSVSVGVVASSPDYQTADEMLRDADTAMYEAKSRGKGRVVVFDPSMQHAVRERYELENDLKAAIGTDQFHLLYQPIVSLEDGELRGVEALVRWEHPARGLIRSDQFIPIAEETHLILQLSAWILDTACRQFTEMKRHDACQTLEYVSVNLSRVQLRDPDLVPGVLRALERHGLRADQLQMEVTESKIMHNASVAADMLKSLKAEDIRLAMDDFGTGQSSLACLHEYPFDVVKIDRAFVSHLHHGNRTFAALLHCIVQLVANLGMRCLAEGIETADQVAVLQSIDCELGQGYYFGRPSPVETILRTRWPFRSDARDAALMHDGIDLPVRCTQAGTMEVNREHRTKAVGQHQTVREELPRQRRRGRGGGAIDPRVRLPPTDRRGQRERHCRQAYPVEGGGAARAGARASACCPRTDAGAGQGV